MRFVDSGQSDRIRILLDLVAALSRASEPQDVLREYSTGIVKLRGPAGFISLSCRGLEHGQYRITRLLNHDNLTDISKADPWIMADQLRVHTGGLLGEIVSRGAPVIVTDLRVENDPVLGDAIAHYRSMLATPLFDNGEPLNWAFQLRREPAAFTTVDLEESILRSNLVGNTVRHVQILKRLRAADARMRAEVDRIASIQRALLPAELPRIPGLSLAANYDTFDQAGGDLYAFHRIADGEDGLPRWAILIGDVSGHGPAAAVVMAMTSTLLTSLPEAVSHSPADTLSYLNRNLSARKIEQSFVTAFLGVYNPATRDLAYAGAGHPPPVWRHVDANGDGDGRSMRIRRLDEARGLPLGVLPDASYANATVTLNPGDTLALFTDGITESRNRSGEFFGIEGVERALGQCSGEPSCLINTLCTLLRNHEGGARPGDDQTLLAMQTTANA